MKQLAIFSAILFSLFLAACGGNTETKKGENEQRTPPSIVTNSSMANQTNSTVVNTARVDKDDNPTNKPPVNGVVSNSKKTDADDSGRKGDADDKHRTSTNVNGTNKRADDDDDDK